MYVLIIVVIIVLILSLLFTQTNDEYFTNNNTKTKPFLWVYWEIKKGHTKKPDYIDLCLETIQKNSKLFNYVLLDDKSVYNYLPDLRKDINTLPLALKSDYIRIALLYKYGGLWLDADTIMMNDMKPVVDKLNESGSDIDFIGFGCTGETCTNGYDRPSNQCMASKKNSILMKKCLEMLNKKLDDYSSGKIKQFEYFDLGKLIIWQAIDKLKKDQMYKYYHFSSAVDGSRDRNGKWIARDHILKPDVNLLDENQLMVVFLVNSTFCGDDPKYNWFCKLNRQQILDSNTSASKLFKKALNN